EDHEHWPVNSELPSKISVDWLRQSHLLSLRNFFGNVYAIVANTYPERAYNPNDPLASHLFHPWDSAFTNWDESQLRDAIRHMIEHHENWAVDASLPAKATAKWFTKANLMGAVTSRFNSSPYEALAFAYPEHAFNTESPEKPHSFHPWDGQMYWD